MSDDIKARALAELTELEAAVFRFGHQVRTFLATFPEDLPQPMAMLPRFGNRTDPGGAFVPGGDSYLHLVVKTAEVNAWASLLQAPVTQEVTETGDYINVSTRASGVLDGLLLYVGASETGQPKHVAAPDQVGAR